MGVSLRDLIRISLKEIVLGFLSGISKGPVSF